MEAGRQLDSLVAEKVMGLASPDKLGPLPSHAAPGNLFDLVPHYSTDIAAAWTVVEKLKDVIPDSRFVLGWQQGCWQVGWWYFEERYFEIEALGGDAAEAICLAALKAVGFEFPNKT